MWILIFCGPEKQWCHNLFGISNRFEKLYLLNLCSFKEGADLLLKFGKVKMSSRHHSKTDSQFGWNACFSHHISMAMVGIDHGRKNES